jgi:hypothetical protein
MGGVGSVRAVVSIQAVAEDCPLAAVRISSRAGRAITPKPPRRSKGQGRGKFVPRVSVEEEIHQVAAHPGSRLRRADRPPRRVICVARCSVGRSLAAVEQDPRVELVWRPTRHSEPAEVGHAFIVPEAGADVLNEPHNGLVIYFRTK